jgi:peptide/nickel transport system substrate-binding protein
MSKRFLILVSAFLALMMLASCGGASNNSNASGGGTTSGGASGSGTSGSGTSGDGAIKSERSRTFNFGYRAPTQLDPNNLRNFTDEIAIRFSYEPIIYTPRDGTGYQPCLAKSWDIAPDGMSWTFYLRDDVTFNNGDPFSADDVVYTVERVINGVAELSFKNQYIPSLKEAEKIDDYTVKVSFTEPSPFAGNGFRALYIIPKKVHEEYGDAMFFDQGTDYFMVGTGPWLTVEWVDGQFIHYLKNHNYWNKANYDSYFEEVYTRHIAEATTGVAAHVAGDVDAYMGIPLDYLKMYAGTEDRIEIINIPSNSWNNFGFKFGEGSMWHDKDVRWAFDLAIDRQGLIDSLYQGFAATVPYGYFGHPSMEGFDASLGMNQYDPDRARELLSNSTYDGRKFEMIVTGNTAEYEQLSMAIMDMLTSVGFNMEVSLEVLANFQARQAAGDYSVYMDGGSFPDGIVQRQLTNRMVNDSSKNEYVNEELYDIIRTYFKEVDATKRNELARTINHILTEEKAPHTPLLFKSAFCAQSYGITGIAYFADGLYAPTFVDWDPSLVP